MDGDFLVGWLGKPEIVSLWKGAISGTKVTHRLKGEMRYGGVFFLDRVSSCLE